MSPEYVGLARKGQSESQDRMGVYRVNLPRLPGDAASVRRRRRSGKMLHSGAWRRSRSAGVPPRNLSGTIAIAIERTRIAIEVITNQVAQVGAGINTGGAIGEPEVSGHSIHEGRFVGDVADTAGWERSSAGVVQS